MIDTRNRYRIVIYYGKFCVQYRKWWCPVWIMCSGKVQQEDWSEIDWVNSHGRASQAMEYARSHARKSSDPPSRVRVVEYLGPV